MAASLQALENIPRQLRAALSANNSDEIARIIQYLQKTFLTNGGYTKIGDEMLLAEILRLMSRCYGEEKQTQLVGLRNHLQLIHTLHDNLFAILDSTDLDELLFDRLENWPVLSEPVGCSFDLSAKHSLDAIRGTGDSEQKLNNFMAQYFQHLSESNLQRTVDALKPSVEFALQGYNHAHGRGIFGLFAVQDSGEVYGIKLSPEPNGHGNIKCLNSVQPDMEKAANSALQCARRLSSAVQRFDYVWEIDRDDIPFGGNSIGLALAVGIIAAVEDIDVDAYTAFTGLVEWETGKVGQIDQITKKLSAARELGIRRVFIPTANANAVSEIPGLNIVPISLVQEALEKLKTRNYGYAHTPSERRANMLLRELELNLKSRGVKLVTVKEEQGFKRVRFTDHRNEIPVDVYHGQKGPTANVGGKDSDLKRIVEEERDLVFGYKDAKGATGAAALERQYRTFVVSDTNLQQMLREQLLAREDSVLETQQDCVFRVRFSKAQQPTFARQFTTGRLLIDGNDPLFSEIVGLVCALLNIPEEQPSDTEAHQVRATTQRQAVKELDVGENWIGTDEAGKGDYFGPLVSGAVLVDKRTAQLLSDLGVKDSKTLTDTRNRELAHEILQVCGKRAQVVVIPPAKYNSLYQQFRDENKNLNTLLAWAHTRAVEDIIVEFPQTRITVLVDKFADEKYVESKLLAESRKADLNIVQMPKAEANIAVAAASVLARAQFLQGLEDLSRQYKVELPKGSSDPRIISIARRIVDQYGPKELERIAKLHFKTTEKVLGKS